MFGMSPFWGFNDSVRKLMTRVVPQGSKELVVMLQHARFSQSSIPPLDAHCGVRPLDLNACSGVRGYGVAA